MHFKFSEGFSKSSEFTVPKNPLPVVEADLGLRVKNDFNYDRTGFSSANNIRGKRITLAYSNAKICIDV